MGLSRLVLVMALVLTNTGARAFDMLGFEGGMSLDAFAAHARAKGYSVTFSAASGGDLPESTWARERLLDARLERTDKGSPERLSAFLCEGKLQSLSELHEGGLDRFVVEVSEALKRFGLPGTAGMARSQRVTPKHFISSLSIGWPDVAGKSTYSVEIVSASGLTVVHRGWSAVVEGCG